MAEFRFQVLGETAYQSFLQAIQDNPTQFLTPVRLRVAPQTIRSSSALGWIDPETSDNGLIYLNLTYIEKVTRGFSTEQMAAFLESTLLHEWVHLIQFSIQTDRPSLNKEGREKRWHQRWYEQEAIYVTERVFRSLVHPKKYSKRNAFGLVRQIAYCPDTPSPFCFKEMALKPYAPAHGVVA